MAEEKKTFIGDVKKYYPKAEVAEIILCARGLKNGEKLSILGPKTGVVTLMADSFYTNDLAATAAGKGDSVTIKCSKVRKNDKVYVLEKRV